MPLTDPSVLNPPQRTNPGFLVYYGKEKCGKTSLAALLPDSYLLVLAHEGCGADFISYKGSTIRSLKELRDGLPTLKKWTEEKKFKYLVIDSADAMVSMLEDEATAAYRNTINKEKEGLVATIMERGYGKGTETLAQLLKDLVAQLRSVCDTLIVIARQKKMDKTEQIVDTADLSLPGKLRDMIVYTADATAWCFPRKNKDTGADELAFVLSAREAISGGTRAPHLANKTIAVGEWKDGNLTAFWDKIFLPDVQAGS